MLKRKELLAQQKAKEEAAAQASQAEFENKWLETLVRFLVELKVRDT